MKSKLKPIFAIVGGTGAQGESALHAIAATCKDQFKFRIFTRNANSDKAMTLKQKYGNDIEIVEGKQTDPAAVDKLFQGVSWAYIVTNFWDPEIMLKEGEVGKCLADACKKHGVQHVIFSTLPHAIKVTNGKYSVPHFDLKAEVEQYMIKIGLNAIFVAPAFYYQNWTTFFTPRQNPDGSWGITLPMKGGKITAIDVTESGKIVAHMVKNFDQFKGKKYVANAGDHLAPTEYVKIISEVTGVNVNYQHMTYDEFQKVAGEEITHMLHYFEDFGFYEQGVDWEQAKKLVGLTNFRDWAKKNAELLKPKV